jgi:hypothetical protein
MHEAVRVMYVPIDMPETKMHARGKDREDDNLETVLRSKRGVVSGNAQQGLKARTLRTWNCTRPERGKCQWLSLRGGGGTLTWRSSDMRIFAAENTFKTRTISMENRSA